MNLEIQLPLGYFPEINEVTQSPLCGKVTREIAALLGRRFPQGENHRLLESYYTKNRGYIGECTLTNFPESARFLDIFLSSGTEVGRHYGHRTIAEKVHGNWLVYDPFLGPQFLLMDDYIAEYRRMKRGEIQKIHAYS